MIPIPIVWLLIGVILILLEIETAGALALVGEAAGFMAIVIAGLAWLLPWLSVPIQTGIWIGLSIFAIWYSRRFIPRKEILNLDNQEGRTMTEIKAGEAGRVKYEGQSWRAIAADPQLTIPADVEVVIMERQGNTLVVMPKNWLKPTQLSEL
ncbi:MAG: NfeD family protein [Pseudanabaenaceae cyanobacterium]